MITAHLASLGNRRNLLPIVLQSISPHVDHIYVALNNYATIPELDIPNVTFKMCDNSKGDAHKFEFINDAEGIVYIADDDLVYSAEFFSLLRAKVKQYNCPVSLHGKKYGRPAGGFKRFKENYRCLNTVVGDHPVDIVGTGVLCMDTSMVKLSMDDFKLPNMADIWFSRSCHLQGVPLMVSEHKAGIVGYLSPKTTIWGDTRNYQPHDKIIRELFG